MNRRIRRIIQYRAQAIRLLDRCSLDELKELYNLKKCEIKVIKSYMQKKAAKEYFNEEKKEH